MLFVPFLYPREAPAWLSLLQQPTENWVSVSRKGVVDFCSIMNSARQPLKIHVHVRRDNVVNQCNVKAILGEKAGKLLEIVRYP